MDVTSRARQELGKEDAVVRLWEIARDAARDGATEGELLAVFQALRHGLSEEQEDQVLEVMDFIVGFCSPHMRVFP